MVVGVAGEARAVRGDDEEVPGGVHRRAGRIPDAALAAGGRVVHDRVPGAVEPDADDAALVVRAVAGLGAERDPDPPAGDGQRPALLHRRRRRSGQVDAFTPADLPGVQVERDQVVADLPVVLRDDVDIAGLRAVDRGAGDAQRVDVAAGPLVGG